VCVSGSFQGYPTPVKGYLIYMKVTVKTLQQTNFSLEIEPSETVKQQKFTLIFNFLKRFFQ
jgi:hypothetical protein